MAYNQLNCDDSLKNTGLACGTENLGYFAKWIWLKEDFEFATQAAAELQANWETAKNAKDIFPFKNFVQVESGTEDDVVESLSTGVDVFVREGKMKETGFVNLALCEMIAHRSFNNKKGRLAFVTSNGYIVAYSPDGAKFKGFSYDMLMVSGMGASDGSTQRRTKFMVSLSDPTQTGDYVVAIKPTWNPLDLEGIIDCDLAVVGTVTNALATWTVKRSCDNEGVTGLVAGDFDFLVTAGTDQSGSSFTEVGAGTYKYTSSGTTFTTGTLAMKTAALQTTKGYEGGNTLAYTI